ncbi:lysozyme-like [Toxorhynchites rutilus septentrionalis]|uniref:lysozyme-like n=1 Tax=Toxorhynchites rutilus septentrionalis TaxID=329112 RepID=UPI00247B2B2F|nr:lysozyme-like [Toxorhynchites rutilus septentrionalis]
MKRFSIFVALATILVVLHDGAEARTFSECQLAKLLRTTYHFDRVKVNNFVCLAAAESSLSTTKTHRNRNGSTDYGLFQINNRYWCSTPGYRSASNVCQVACSDLMKDDITKAVNCANKVYARHGYNAWEGWKAKCKNGVKDLSYCM